MRAAHTRLWMMVVLLSAAHLSAAGRAELDLDLSIFRHKGLGIRLSIPEGWTASEQTGYPSLLLILTSAETQSSMSVAVGSLEARQSLRDHVSRNSLALTAVRIKVLGAHPVGSQALWELSASTPRGPATEIRQLYLARGQTVLVFTLCCPAAHLDRHAADLHDLARALR